MPVQEYAYRPPVRGLPPPFSIDLQLMPGPSRRGARQSKIRGAPVTAAVLSLSLLPLSWCPCVRTAAACACVNASQRCCLESMQYEECVAATQRCSKQCRTTVARGLSFGRLASRQSVHSTRTCRSQVVILQVLQRLRHACAPAHHHCGSSHCSCRAKNRRIRTLLFYVHVARSACAAITDVSFQGGLTHAGPMRAWCQPRAACFPTPIPAGCHVHVHACPCPQRSWKATPRPLRRTLDHQRCRFHGQSIHPWKDGLGGRRADLRGGLLVSAGRRDWSVLSRRRPRSDR